MNRNVVVVDAAHGGPDAGGRLGDQLLEKDLTLALAARLREALSAAGFAVVSTRTVDPQDELASDQRAETANRVRAVACLVLHATASGSGVHLYLSPLTAKEVTPEAEGGRPRFVPTPWDTAQAEYVGLSGGLEGDLGAAMDAGHLPLLRGQAEVRPLDNLMCPALAVELAPLQAEGMDTLPVTDAAYQQRVVDTLVRGLQAWRTRQDAAVAAAAAAANAKGPGGAQ